MITFMIFALATVGMTTIMINSNFPLVKLVRDKVEASSYTSLHELWGCPMCMGWWCGLIMALMLYPAGWMTFPLACTGSIVSRFADSIFDNLTYMATSSMYKSQLLDIQVEQVYKSRTAVKKVEPNA